MRILYPLMASALITIVPFLLTFEKGQDIVRGLFGYEYFAILLLIIFVRSKFSKAASAPFASLQRKRFALSVAWRKQFLCTICLALLFIALISIAWMDVQDLLAIKGWKTGWHGVLPFITCSLAIAMTWKTRPFSFNGICFVLFVALILHLASYNQYANQPLAQFPTIDYLDRIAPKSIQRKEISNEYRNKYVVTDSVTITRDYIDTTRNNVIILIESWGAPLDIKRFEKQLKIFEGVHYIAGIHNRMYSRTRTAEREDLLDEIHSDSTKKKDSTFLPQFFSRRGFRTSFLVGNDSLKHLRNKYLSKMGFDNVLYLKGFSDADIASKIDSILADSTQKNFIAWTTSDTKFPLDAFSDMYHSKAADVDSVYTLLLNESLRQIARLAQKYPRTRFIIQGDHNPIISPIEFQEKFYRRWVPFAILN